MLGRRHRRQRRLPRARLRRGRIVERIALPPQQREHRGGPKGRAQVGPAPVPAHRGQPDQHHRRECPAQVPADPVHREGMAQARARDPLVQDREVHRVERRVADAGQCGRQHQPGIAVCGRRRQRREDEARQRAEQHRTGADTVDQEACQGLAGARNHEEHRHQQAELGVAQAEVPDEGREQRRQQHVEEVRGAVRQPDQADRAGVLAQRHGRQSGVHAAMLRPPACRRPAYARRRRCGARAARTRPSSGCHALRCTGGTPRQSTGVDGALGYHPRALLPRTRWNT